VPSTFTAATISDLIADITAANKAGGPNTIALGAGDTFSLTAVDNTTDGATGLPVIAANDNLTILGNGDTIARSTASGTPAFRLFDVAVGASLKLENLTVQGGLAFGSGVSAEGGGIYNQGALDLDAVTVQGNVAQGQNGRSGFGSIATAGQAAAGGGIYSSGALTLEAGTSLQNNQAIGGKGGTSISPFWGYSGLHGGNGSGGGVYASGGTSILTDVTLSSNTAQGGQGGYGLFITHILSTPHGGGGGGNGFGGALDVSGGTVTLRQTTVSANSAVGGKGGAYNGPVGLGEGGGLSIDAAALVYLDAITLANISNNTASTTDPNIHGSYKLLP
jgi:hypothetical protein